MTKVCYTFEHTIQSLVVEKLLIEYRGVDIFQEENMVLQQVNFDLAYAEFAYIIGRSGSGKSSLLRSMVGDLSPRGQVARVGETDLLTLKPRDIYKHKRQVGMIFQDFQLFPQWTVARNLRFVLYATDWKDKAAAEDRIDEVLIAVNLLQHREVPAHKLSGGEQQRLAIARSLLNHPAILIADEPTGNLDPDTSDDILYLLSDVARNHKTAIVLATHDYRLIDKFKARVYRCENQALVEQ